MYMFNGNPEAQAKSRCYFDKQRRNFDLFDHMDHEDTVSRLEAQYIDEISSWDWQEIKQNAIDNCENPYEDDSSQLKGSCYLGTVFSIMPSGKFYMPWACSNVTENEAEQDEIFMDRLESIASIYDLSIESGEGDPCDLFAVVYLDNPDPDTNDDCDD